MLNPEIKNEWIIALRSGDYKQGKSVLQSEHGTFCCLGVICDILQKKGVVQMTPDALNRKSYKLKIEVIGDDAILSDGIAQYLGIDSDPIVHYFDMKWELSGLAALNDTGVSFAEIATLIEEQL